MINIIYDPSGAWLKKYMKHPNAFELGQLRRVTKKSEDGIFVPEVGEKLIIKDIYFFEGDIEIWFLREDGSTESADEEEIYQNTEVL